MKKEMDLCSDYLLLTNKDGSTGGKIRRRFRRRGGRQQFCGEDGFLLPDIRHIQQDCATFET
jgi:hypothetical protein